jgi:tetratricopeptide (TPR) repeat protein
VLVLAAATLRAPRAAAQDSDGVREAARHFQRGVALYSEADYRAALVEFKRAGALAPNSATLYNIGEAQYQLQDYAGALTTFERFLVEAGPNDSHRAEVEGNIQALRTRVGYVAVTTVPFGAEITIDDQPVGRTPLDKPVRVTIGQRKVVGALSGRPPVTRYVDVAAEDNVSVTLLLPASVGAADSAPLVQQPPVTTEAPRSSRGSVPRVVGWVATGVLAAGAATFGVLALKQSKDLSSSRESFPITKPTLEHSANLATTYSILADAFGAGALIVGGLTLYSTLSSPANPPQAAATRVSLGLASVNFHATF